MIIGGYYDHWKGLWWLEGYYNHWKELWWLEDIMIIEKYYNKKEEIKKDGHKKVV